MPTIQIAPEVTGPVAAPVSPTPPVGRATRRKFRLAALVRRNRRRATWIRAEHAGELPPIAMVTSIVGAVVLTFTLTAWVWVR